MDTKKIKALLTAVECGSLTSAAESLRYTQSGLTHMMNALEDELGVSILVRNKTGVRLSPAGMSMLEDMKALVAASDALERDAELLRQQSYSMLRVGAYSSVSVHWVPSILEEYKLMSPEYNTSISMNDIRQTYDAVKNDQLDVAFVSYQEELMSGLEWVPLRDDELLAVLPGKYSREEGSFPVEFFSGLDFLMPKGGFDMDIMPIFAGLPQEKLPQFRYTNMDDAAIVSMAAHGLGVSVLSELVLQDTKDSTAIVPLSPPGYRRLGIIYKSRSGSDRTIRRFISCAQDVLRKMYGDA